MCETLVEKQQQVKKTGTRESFKQIFPLFYTPHYKKKDTLTMLFQNLTTGAE